jgi:hypothetical protein
MEINRNQIAAAAWIGAISLLGIVMNALQISLSTPTIFAMTALAFGLIVFSMTLWVAAGLDYWRRKTVFIQFQRADFPLSLPGVKDIVLLDFNREKSIGREYILADRIHRQEGHDNFLPFETEPPLAGYHFTVTNFGPHVLHSVFLAVGGEVFERRVSTDLRGADLEKGPFIESRVGGIMIDLLGMGTENAASFYVVNSGDNFISLLTPDRLFAYPMDGTREAKIRVGSLRSTRAHLLPRRPVTRVESPAPQSPQDTEPETPP